MEFQVNTTVTRENADEVQEILDMVIDLGAVAHHIFLLVPTGRAKDMGSAAVFISLWLAVICWGLVIYENFV